MKESKKNCRKAKIFEGKQNYLKENRILTPQGHRKIRKRMVSL